MMMPKAPPDSMKRKDQVLDAEVARRVRNLTLQARRAVDGILTGMHKSPHRGASVVFVEHREYRPGDDLRLLDWRAFARTDRDVIKRFEQETQLRATLVLDRSGSMGFAGSSGPRKIDHAASVLAAFAYLLVNQGDAAGVALIGEQLGDSLVARSRPAHMDAVLAALARGTAAHGATDLELSLRQLAEHAGRRGVVVVASDLLDLSPTALVPLRHLVTRGNDVIIFHVLTPDELELSQDYPCRFVGLEGEPHVEVDPRSVRAAYQEEVDRFIAACRDRCLTVGARYTLCRTDVSVERLLASMLAGSRRSGFR